LAHSTPARLAGAVPRPNVPRMPRISRSPSPPAAAAVPAAAVLTATFAAFAVFFAAAGDACGQLAPDSEVPRLDERTALLLGARKLKLGALAFDYGITDRVTVGTDPPAWAARAFLPILVPNLHIKVAIVERERVWLSVRAAGYWAKLSESGAANADLLAVPLSLFASFAAAPKIWLHGEGTFILAKAFGGGDVGRTDVSGAAATRAVQGGAMIEYRPSRVVALLLRGRYQFYVGPLAFEGSSQPDAFTAVDLQGRLEPRVRHPWSALAAVALMWRHVRLLFGAGYGYYFVPGIEIAVPGRRFVPDASLAVVF
jgi:hypothetical protein